MTYNVFGGTLSLTQSINQPLSLMHKSNFKGRINGKFTMQPKFNTSSPEIKCKRVNITTMIHTNTLFLSVLSLAS